MMNVVLAYESAVNDGDEDAFRALKPGGRLAVADIVATAELPREVREDLALHAGCVAGAAQIHEIETMLVEAGFTNVSVTPVDETKTISSETPNASAASLDV